MSSQFFEGAAGTGKTYNLMTSLEGLVMARHLDKHQKVLALTFMHGSRARLDGALSELRSLRKRFDCMTFDAFAGYIVNRWRDLLGDVQQRQNITKDHNEYEQVCYEAAEMLKNESVQRWVSHTYPIFLVDEAQDLSPARLAMMQSLASSSILLAAADEYQHLDENHDGNEAVQWLSGNINTTPLTRARRTNDQGLLQVAHNLRNGEAIVPLLNDRSGRKELGNFKLITVPSWQYLSWQAGYGLFDASECGDHVILALSSKDANANKAIDRIKNQQQNLNKRRGTTFGPFQDIKQVRSAESLAQKCYSSLSLPEESLSTGDALERCAAIEELSIRENVCGWIARRKRIAGQTELSREELEAAVSSAFNNQRRFQRRGNVRRQAMTIHQAKNREFDNVIILWTYALGGNASDEYKRRLLYNAITRAKKRCTVVVMGANRINEAPFSVAESLLGFGGQGLGDSDFNSA